MKFLKFRGQKGDIWVNPEHVVTVEYNVKWGCVEMRLSGDRLVMAEDFNDPEQVLYYLKTGYRYSTSILQGEINHD
tara:strand:+ start:110 stop:337 length:228 start_codon:yes stop_codon:yes gene_type:complete